MEYILEVIVYWSNIPLVVEMVASSCYDALLDIGFITKLWGADSLTVISCTVEV